MQKPANWLGWISAAHLTWKKSYCVLRVGSLQYYWFRVLRCYQTLGTKKKLPIFINWRELSFSLTQGHIQQELCKEKYQILAGLLDSIHQVIPFCFFFSFGFFFSTKCFKQSNDFPKKIKWKRFLSLKPNKFHLRGIKNLPDEWEAVMRNNGEYTIDSNWFIVKLLMNKLYFTLFITRLYIYIYIYRGHE